MAGFGVELEGPDEAGWGGGLGRTGIDAAVDGNGGKGDVVRVDCLMADDDEDDWDWVTGGRAPGGSGWAEADAETDDGVGDGIGVGEDDDLAGGAGDVEGGKGRLRGIWRDDDGGNVFVELELELELDPVLVDMGCDGVVLWPGLTSDGDGRLSTLSRGSPFACNSWDRLLDDEGTGTERAGEKEEIAGVGAEAAFLRGRGFCCEVDISLFAVGGASPP